MRDEDRNELEPEGRRVERRVQCAEQLALAAQWRLELRVGEAGKEGGGGSDLPDELSRLTQPIVVASRKVVLRTRPSSLTGWYNPSGSVKFFRTIVGLTTSQRNNAWSVVGCHERSGRMKRTQARAARCMSRR